MGISKQSSDEALEHAIVTIYKARRVERCNVFLSKLDLKTLEEYAEAKELYYRLSHEARQILYALVVTPWEVLEAFEDMKKLSMTQRLVNIIRRYCRCPPHRARIAIEEAKIFMREVDGRPC